MNNIQKYSDNERNLFINFSVDKRCIEKKKPKITYKNSVEIKNERKILLLISKRRKELNEFLNAGKTKVTEENFSDLEEIASQQNMHLLLSYLFKKNLKEIKKVLGEVHTENNIEKNEKQLELILTALLDMKKSILFEKLPLNTMLDCDQLISDCMCYFPYKILSILTELENRKIDLKLINFSKLKTPQSLDDDLLMKILMKNKNFFSLNLNGCTNITKTIILMIPCLHPDVQDMKLKELDVRGCNIKEEDLLYLRNNSVNIKF